MLRPMKKFFTAAVIGAVSLSSLTACVISDDPYVNTAATAVATAGVVSMLLYAVNDGYYYDQNYNRMPRNYRPPRDVQVVRVNNIHEYRQKHSHPAPQPRYHHSRQYRQQSPQYWKQDDHYRHHYYR